MENEADDVAEPEDASELIHRLEQALDRIGRGAHGATLEGMSGMVPADEIARRLDALIARVRTALAERPGEV